MRVYEQITQDNGIIMLCIMGGEDEGNRPVFQQSAEFREGFFAAF